MSAAPMRVLTAVILLHLAASAPAAPLAGDANGDRRVDLDDFVLLKTNFGTPAGAVWGQGDFDADGDVDLDDFVILKHHFGDVAPATGRPVLTVVESPGDHYRVTAHDSVDPDLGYWEILVDVQSGGIYSFRDLTDAGTGDGHASVLDASAYNRKATLFRFDGRGGDVFSRQAPVGGLADRLTFTTDPDGRSFTIAYEETADSSDWYHGSYADGDRSLSPGELLTAAALVIRPPGVDGTAWEWTIRYENVCDHALSAKIWAVDSRQLHLYGGLAKTADGETARVDGPWDPLAPVSFTRWTLGDNAALGLTAGRQFILDCQSGLEGHTHGGSVSTGSWAGFDYRSYGAGYGLTAEAALQPGGVRVESGQLIIDIAGEGASVPPTADAGPDQTLIDADDSGAEDVSLDGSPSGDPDGTIVAYDWREDGVTIATGATPMISLAPGVHTIELVVTDDAGDTGSDTVVITVQAYLNLPPDVEAGPHLKVTAGSEVPLFGSAADDGLPLTGSLATAWSQVDGPAIAVFQAPDALSTTAVFPADGVYTLQLLADDGELAAADTLTVTVDSTTPAPQWRGSITQYGITWTFDHVHQTGQFANGDWWVVGPVSITAIDPVSEVVIGTTSLDGFVAGGADPRPRTMNGSMLDPVTPPGGSRQGFDSEMYIWHSISGAIYGPKYDAAMNVALGVSAATPLRIPQAASLVSTISHPQGAQPQLKAAAVLTVLDDVPPDNGATCFRPPYSGADKPLYSIYALRKDLLPNLPLVANTPSLASVAATFQRPWIDHFGHVGDGTQYSSPTDNMPSYGREYSMAVGRAALLLLLDEAQLVATQGRNKDELLIRFVQLGIDLYHVTENGGYWWGKGGLNHGRKWPILFAGLMLDHEHMRTIGSRSKSMPYWGFAEDAQTGFLSQADVDRTHSAQWRPDTRAAQLIPCEADDVGTPEWNGGGWAPGLDPYGLNLYYGTPYRTIDGMSYPGPVLAALIMGQRSAWNHEALFDYTDRYVAWSLAWNAGYSQQDIDVYIYGGAFQRAMWEAYRATCPPVWSE
ncbi:MAG: hypothetical protein GX591_14365 [Planctomycetes bacterium]|nr:hypothetical protein [Planctomycetota bacterium]